MINYISTELRRHAPFTLSGVATGIVIMIVFMLWDIPRHIPQALFGILHPLHVFLSAVAISGIVIAWYWPQTRVPHAGHVLISTWASLFHMVMALGGSFGFFTVILVGVFLFLAVWIPCCTSDIVFPLLAADLIRLNKKEHS